MVLWMYADLLHRAREVEGAGPGTRGPKTRSVAALEADIAAVTARMPGPGGKPGRPKFEVFFFFFAGAI